MQHFAYPHAGQWYVAHFVPGTTVVHLDMPCPSFETAQAEARRMTREAMA